MESLMYNSLVNKHLFYANFTNMQFEKDPIFIFTIKLALIEKMESG